jgi:hypothetical protein
MDTLADIRTAVQSDLTIDSNSTLFPVTTIDLTINRAYRKVGGLFRWPGTEDAKKTSTQVGLEYYDYPQNWRDDSIWRLEVDDEQYGEEPDGSPLGFEDYLTWRRDTSNASSTDKKWSNQKRRFFIYPVPTTAGEYNISVWGQKVVDALSEDDDYTIFSYSMPEVNEAIVLETVAILKSKGEEEEAGGFRSAEAKQIILTSWSKIRQEQSKYEKNLPFFDVPDFFGSGNSKDMRGRFDL